jgi:hypothetical protein
MIQSEADDYETAMEATVYAGRCLSGRALLMCVLGR